MAYRHTRSLCPRQVRSGPRPPSEQHQTPWVPPVPHVTPRKTGSSCESVTDAGPQRGACPAHLMVLAVQDEVQHDEVIAVAGGLHVEQEAVDEVLDEAPEEHPQHEEAREHGLRHGY